ncbi:hypothetical protein A33M_3347 [Rhodovulum sp. PH10]|uniref:helix-turn-helix domain-containing protein n=1 Tax=Rhodovulum sp. PH10 TaxID=1187851 RepID=UPI00027C2939|nr:helix-turn-helix domain-containing protein [Rhodovulum sp. PH10]EJW11269.1 hypothetical protein A33M_3347 [Rhodovulum sp. PH10]
MISESEYARRWRRDVETGPSAAIALWRKGRSSEDIADTLGRPVETVRGWIRRHRENITIT